MNSNLNESQICFHNILIHRLGIFFLVSLNFCVNSTFWIRQCDTKEWKKSTAKRISYDCFVKWQIALAIVTHFGKEINNSNENKKFMSRFLLNLIFKTKRFFFELFYVSAICFTFCRFLLLSFSLILVWFHWFGYIYCGSTTEMSFITNFVCVSPILLCREFREKITGFVIIANAWVITSIR